VKLTSIKELDNYIYSSIILPLKGLDVPPVVSSSPMEMMANIFLHFEIRREEIRGDFQHNFQREAARELAGFLVVALVGYNGYIAAHYDQHRHRVTVWPEALTKLGAPKLVVNRFTTAFEEHTPFDKVETAAGVGSITRVVTARDLP
jgi:hypothetical protein